MSRRHVFADRSSGRYITYYASPRSGNQYAERPDRNLGGLMGPPQRRDLRGYQENIERPRGVLSFVARRAGVDVHCKVKGIIAVDADPVKLQRNRKSKTLPDGFVCGVDDNGDGFYIERRDHQN